MMQVLHMSGAGNDFMVIDGRGQNLNYEELLVVNSDGNKIRFLAENTDGDFLSNLLLSINSEEETVFMILDGALKYDDINTLVNNN